MKKITHQFQEFRSILYNFSFKISPRTLKNVHYFESYLKFKKALKF